MRVCPHPYRRVQASISCCLALLDILEVGLRSQSVQVKTVKPFAAQAVHRSGTQRCVLALSFPNYQEEKLRESLRKFKRRK